MTDAVALYDLSNGRRTSYPAALVPAVIKAIKDPVRVASSGNLTLSGLQTVDGVALAEDDRVLVRGQTDATQNGVYVAQSGAWSRSLDFSESQYVGKGTLVWVQEGTAYGNSLWAMTASDAPIIFGTTQITWSLTSISQATLDTLASLSDTDWANLAVYGPKLDELGPQITILNDALDGLSLFGAQGERQTATAYALLQTVVEDGVAYVCLENHTSGTFATDLADGKWAVMQGVLRSDLLGEDEDKGSALVAIAQDTADNVMLRAAPRLKLDRLHYKIAKMVEDGSGVVGLMAHGDSVGLEPWPVEGARELVRRFGIRGMWAGRSTIALARHPAVSVIDNIFGSGTTNTDFLEDQYAFSPTGQMYRLDASGEQIRFIAHRMTGSPYHFAIDRATIIYTRQSGGGEFQVGYQYSLGDQTNDQDVILATIDTDNATPDVQSYQVDLPVKAVDVDVFVRWVSGTSLVSGALLEDTDASGILFTALVKGGLAMDGQASATPTAVWAKYLEVMRPDLIAHSFKDDPVDLATELATHRTLIDGAITAASIDTPDQVYLVPTPSNTETDNVRSEAVKTWMSFAVENGYPYYDLWGDIQNHTAAEAIGMFGDGTHLAAEGIAAYGLRFMEAAGLFRPWDNPRGEAEIVRTKALEINGANAVEEARRAAIAGIERTRGLKLASHNPVATASAFTAVGEQSFTLMAIVRVPTSGLFLLPGFSSVQNVNSNAAGAVAPWVNGNAIDLNIRNPAGDATEVYRTQAVLGDWKTANAGKLVVVALRRDMSLTGKPKVSAFADDRELVLFKVAGQATLDHDLSASVHLLSHVNNIFEGDIYGIGLTFSALSNEMILEAMRTMHIPEEMDAVRWLFDEQGGIVVRDTNGTNHGFLPGQVTGPSAGHATWQWLNEDRHTPRPHVLTGDYSLYPQGDYINDGGTSGNPNEFTLPVPTAVGQRIRIANAGGRWKLECRADMKVLEGAGGTTGTDVTTVGTSGYVQCGADFDSIELTAVEVDTSTPAYTWAVVGGNHTLTWN